MLQAGHLQDLNPDASGIIYEVRVYSLEAGTLGQVLHSKQIKAAHCLTSVQFSPTSEHLLLAYGRSAQQRLSYCMQKRLALSLMAPQSIDKSPHNISDCYYLHITCAFCIAIYNPAVFRSYLNVTPGGVVFHHVCTCSTTVVASDSHTCLNSLCVQERTTHNARWSISLPPCC